ncbi:hypothetical protein [Microbacterium aoyamense]|uniref:hypothetical protein n=1 Tax=Microbacterium aoyamense TaxID=344166 RepID=UPI00200663D8|nr:hypothetical protein [Microbacterium aoyamense]
MTWIWGSVVLAIALVFAGGVAWWLAKGCVVTRIGAVGAIVGGLGALGCLTIMFDTDAAIRIATVLVAVFGVWLFAWAIAGGVRGQRLDRAREAEAVVAPESRRI